MRQLPEGLQDHLDTGATTLCLCWHLQGQGNLSLGLTDHDEPLSFNGIDFEPESGFSGTAVESSLGLAVDTQDVSGALKSDALNEADLRAGVFDDAQVDIWLVNWQVPEQRLLLRRGNIGEVTRGPSVFTAEIRSLSHRLNQTQGRIFQHACDAELGDARCGVDLNAPDYTALANITEVKDNHTIIVSGIENFLDNGFELGVLEFTEGSNQARKLRIASHRNDADTVSVTVESAPAHPFTQGEIIKLIAGCDKRFETCRSKFSNSVNFRGFPHMPGNDFVTYYPSSGDTGNDGSSRN